MQQDETLTYRSSALSLCKAIVSVSTKPWLWAALLAFDFRVPNFSNYESLTITDVQ